MSAPSPTQIEMRRAFQRFVGAALTGLPTSQAEAAEALEFASVIHRSVYQVLAAIAAAVMAGEPVERASERALGIIAGVIHREDDSEASA